MKTICLSTMAGIFCLVFWLELLSTKGQVLICGLFYFTKPKNSNFKLKRIYNKWFEHPIKIESMMLFIPSLCSSKFDDEPDRPIV